MNYEWYGIRVMTIEEVKERFEKGTLVGCYKLYDDGTEAVIDKADTWEEIEKHIDQGGRFAEETGKDMRKVKNEVEAQIRVFVTNEDIDDIMVSALEGGINYWCSKAEVVGEYLGEYASDQISRGGELILYDMETELTYTLTKEKFLDGIKKYIAEGNVTCITRSYEGNLSIDCCLVDGPAADCIVQLAVFGEIIYG